MPKAPRSRQALQRKRDGQAQAAPSWRCGGLDVQGGTMEPRREAAGAAQANHGAPGIAGVTVEARAASGVEPCLEHRRDALGARPEQPLRVRRKERPQAGGTTVRVRGLPTMRARGVQGALQVILAPLVEAAVQPGSEGYRPQRSAPAAVERVAAAMARGQPRGSEGDRHAYGDTLRPPGLLATVATRLNAAAVLPLFHGLLQASGSPGVPPGGVRSPRRSHRYRSEVDRRRERAKEVTRSGTYTSSA